MRTVNIFLMSSLLAAAAGCQPGGSVDVRAIKEVVADGLSVRIEIPKRDFTVGDEFIVKLTARNTTSRPIKIDARTGTPVYVRLRRHTGVGWEEIKTYPQADVMAVNPWTLKARAERNFLVRLKVEPDWPTGEVLELTGELNSRPEAAPGVTITARLLPPPEK
ncbi:MAG: hypothetical protein SVT52_05480 [Planctomycetota bacterium]|nr:hypothetical protein [Planctomycetota bacterium]